MIEFRPKLKRTLLFIANVLKFCVYAAMGALCMSIGISDMFNDKFAGIGLEGAPCRFLK